MSSLIGRDAELRLLERFTIDLSSGGWAVMVCGEAGIGKTALLQQAADLAVDVRRVEVRGVESEIVLPYAAIRDVLAPFQDFFADLPEVQRSALEVSLALADGAPPAPLAVCAAALGVLAAAGERQPLLLIIDDFQWIDPSSQQVLLFVARRLNFERVGMLLAVRDQIGEAWDRNLTTLRLGGLTLRDCGRLLERLGIQISPHVLASLVEQTGGNPLAVIETASAIPSERRLGNWSRFDRPRIGPSVAQVWSDLVNQLPPPTRHALVVLSAGSESSFDELNCAMAALGLKVADLRPAEQRDLIRAGPYGLSLRHPLLRSVVLDMAPLGVQISAYRALAECSDTSSANLVHGSVMPWYGREYRA